MYTYILTEYLYICCIDITWLVNYEPKRKYMDMDRVERRIGQITDVRSGMVVVRIARLSACAGCHAQSVCASSDCVERYVTVAIMPTDQFNVGDIVAVEGKVQIGLLAVLLSFVLPILLLFVSLFWGIRVMDFEESVAVLLALVVLMVYYGALRIFDPMLGRVLRLTIRKEQEVSVI